MSRLAEILKQEYKTKGVFSGASSALSKNAREKMDIRNNLFGGSGLGSIIGRKIFGKGYSAIDSDRSKVSSASDAISSGSSTILQEISINGKITAKNSMALPRLAEQMNIMQKNVAKLVRLQGETPSTKAHNFFSDSKFRENAYEATFNKNIKSTKPTKVEEKKGSGGLGILGILGAMGSVFGALLTPLTSLTSFLGAAALAAAAFGGAVFKILRFLVGTKIGKLLGLGALLGASGVFAGTPNENSLETPSAEQSNIGSTFVNTAAGVGGALAGASAIGAGSKLITAGKTTAGAISNARVAANPYVQMSGGATDPKSKWGRFLKFLARKFPTLFAKFGARLASAGALLAIPIAGWVGALIQLGFSIWTAYEIYQAWKEFSDSEETEAATGTVEDISPTPQNQQSGFAGKLGALNQATRQSAGLSPTSPTKVGGSGDSQKSIEEYLGRAITPDEYDMLMRAVYAESSRNKDEYANVMAVILNRTRKRGGSIIDTLNEKNQFQAVTGTANNPGPSPMFKRGPDDKSQAMIAEGALSLSGISKNLDAFTAANRNAYGPGTNVGWLDKLQAGGGKQIGQTVFAENMYGTPSSGSKLGSASSALAAASRPSGSNNQVIDNKTINNNTQTASGGSSQMTAYDQYFGKYLIDRTT
jgi:hypothetical protein